MPIDLYYHPGSPPCRAVLLTASALNVDLNLRLTNLMNGEHLTSEFLKMNPQHNIPTMNDNGFILNESRAIMCYLANQYGKDDSLYPKDPKKRAIIDQRLYFDMGTLYLRFTELYFPMMFAGELYNEEKAKKIHEALGFLEEFLQKSTFAAGENITLADHALLASISTIEVTNFDLSKYSNITKWSKKCKDTTPNYEKANGEGALVFKGLFDSVSKSK